MASDNSENLPVRLRALSGGRGAYGAIDQGSAGGNHVRRGAEAPQHGRLADFLGRRRRPALPDHERGHGGRLSLGHRGERGGRGAGAQGYQQRPRGGAYPRRGGVGRGQAEPHRQHDDPASAPVRDDHPRELHRAGALVLCVIALRRVGPHRGPPREGRGQAERVGLAQGRRAVPVRPGGRVGQCRLHAQGEPRRIPHGGHEGRLRVEGGRHRRVPGQVHPSSRSEGAPGPDRRQGGGL